jgi:Phosphodiester glycosidase
MCTLSVSTTVLPTSHTCVMAAFSKLWRVRSRELRIQRWRAAMTRVRSPSPGIGRPEALFSKRKKFIAAALIIFIVGILGGGPSTCWDCRTPRLPVEIFQGVTYGAESLDPSPENRGLLHWVQIDLTSPGIELYVTPLDATAVANGWQYRLRWIADVVRREKLAVAINGTLFTTHLPWLMTIPGDFAKSVETVVADHVVSHVWEHSYLLRFDDMLRPSLGRTKPPMPSELAAAKWGIGGQAVWLQDGKVWPGSSSDPNARTAVGIDRSRQLLFLAVGEFVSPRVLLHELAVLAQLSLLAPSGDDFGGVKA